MKILTTIDEVRVASSDISKAGKTIGLIPTMGYLHEGHLSLFDNANEHSDITFASIFVNPTQFGPNEDYNKYPRDIDRDTELAEEHNVDYLFIPDALEMYPIGFCATMYIRNLTDKFEGQLRPGHFDGVALVVCKLFNIIRPDYAFFGQKDYQQTLVVKQMVKDLNMDTKIIVSPTIRLDSGLAMSSRNTYLSDEEKENATVLYYAMERAKDAIDNGERNRKEINAVLHKQLRSVQGIRIDYASIALANDLSEPDYFYPNEQAVILLAVYIGKTRLIDNFLITFQ
ncbi:MAG: pantoate--beta-alanine ligase [Ignavibacteria bacterium]|jgi:pantoate--beta-alanine ligase|nr:pantoate--beta-alanine ligase [Ignavibacteria bacterium]